jgi:hypothetical protein
MKNHRFLTACAVLFAVTAAAAHAQTCDLQKESSVTLTISIDLTKSIYYVECNFAFSAGLSPAFYNVSNGTGDGTCGTYTFGAPKYSDTSDITSGYYVTLTSGKLTIRKNPAGTGAFAAGDASSWQLVISNIDISVPYTITSATAVPYNTSGSMIAGTTTSVTAAPCNTKPNPATSITVTRCGATARRVTLTAVGATDPNGDDLTYNWTVTGGTIVSTPVTAASVDVLYNTPGTPDTFTASVIVQDVHEAVSSSKSSPPIYPNDPPVVTTITPMNSTTTPLRVAFSSNASDPDGDALTYQWKFWRNGAPDGTDNVANPQKDYAADGATYQVSLVVTDVCGLSSAETAKTDVHPQAPPSIKLQPPSGLRFKGAVYYGPSPLVVVLAPFDYNGYGSPLKELRWNLGDSPPTIITDSSGSLSSQGVQIPEPGRRTVTLVAVAQNGFESSPVAVALGAYPGEKAVFPQVIGVPYDSQVAPYVDGILTGPDGQAEPPGQPDAGRVYGENGWRGSFSTPYGDGTQPHVRVDMIRDGTTLFLGFDVSSDDAVSDYDILIVGIGKNDQARIDDASGAVALLKLHPSAPGTIDLSTKNAVGAWGAFGALPAGTGIDFKVNKDNIALKRWSAELKLPTGTGPGVPSWLNVDGQFLFFFDFYRAESTTPSIVRFTWPRTISDVQDITDLNSPQFDPVWWGIACRDNSLPSNGLALPTFASIGAQNPADPTGPLTSSIKFKTPTPSEPNNVLNTLVARVQNDARRDVLVADVTQPQMLEAKDVRVLFKIANWGVPSAEAGYWQPIDVAANPTAYADVPAGTSVLTDPDGPGPEEPRWVITPAVKEYTLPWVLTEDQTKRFTPDSTDADGVNEKHQCILVEIETGAGSGDAVNIVTRSVHRNMNFDAQNAVQAFSSKAEIGAEGYVSGLRMSASAGTRFLLRLFTRQWNVSPKDVQNLEPHTMYAPAARVGVQAAGAAEPPYLAELLRYILKERQRVFFIEYVVKAYRFTDNKITIGKKTFDEVVPVGSYGYVVRHVGQTDDWDFRIEGAQKIDDTTYILTVPPGGRSGTVSDYVRARKPPRFSFGLLAGAGTQLADTVPGYGAGPGGVLSAAWNMGRDDNGVDLSLQALLGYDYMTGWNNINLTGLFRTSFYLAKWLRPYLAFGPGGFLDATGTPRFAWVLGTGLELGSWYSFHLQAGVDFSVCRALGTVVGHASIGLIYRME